LAFAPAGFELERVVARSGSRVVLLGIRDDEELEVEVTTLARALGSSERKAFVNAMEQLPALEPEPVAGIRGGRVWGRRLVVERTPISGIALAEKIRRTGRMSLDATMDVIRPLTE